MKPLARRGACLPGLGNSSSSPLRRECSASHIGWSSTQAGSTEKKSWERRRSPRGVLVCGGLPERVRGRGHTQPPGDRRGPALSALHAKSVTLVSQICSKAHTSVLRLGSVHIEEFILSQSLRLNPTPTRGTLPVGTSVPRPFCTEPSTRFKPHQCWGTECQEGKDPV